MSMTTLQRNSLQQMADTLRDLSSAHRQLEYKAAVPFVHVPNELIAQWDRYARMAREGEAPWFRELFSPQELEAIAEFHEVVARTWLPGDKLLDVPAILSDSRWLHLGRQADALSQVLSSKLPPPTER
jgi:hypothetical protein